MCCLHFVLSFCPILRQLANNSRGARRQRTPPERTSSRNIIFGGWCTATCPARPVSPLEIFRTSQAAGDITNLTDAYVDAPLPPLSHFVVRCPLPVRLSDAGAVQRRGGAGSSSLRPAARHGGVVFGQQSRELGARHVSCKPMHVTPHSARGKCCPARCDKL